MFTAGISIPVPSPLPLISLFVQTLLNCGAEPVSHRCAINTRSARPCAQSGSRRRPAGPRPNKGPARRTQSGADELLEPRFVAGCRAHGPCATRRPLVGIPLPGHWPTCTKYIRKCFTGPCRGTRGVGCVTERRGAPGGQGKNKMKCQDPPEIPGAITGGRAGLPG